MHDNKLAESADLSSQHSKVSMARFMILVPAILATQLLGNAFYFSPENVSTFWPSSGLVIAILLLTKIRFWPAILAILISVQIATEMTIYERSFGYTMAFLLPICTEVLLAAGILRFIFSTPLRIWDNRDFSCFIVAAVIGATLAGAMVGAAVVKFFFPVVSYWQVWQIWWFADALGVLIVAPPILAWVEYRKDRLDRFQSIKKRPLEIAALGLSLLAVSILAFSAVVGERWAIFDFPYVAIPFLVWAAVRFDIRIATASLLITSGILVWNTVLGTGPFVITGLSSTEIVLALQAYLTFTSLTVIILSNQVERNQTSETALRESEERFRDFAGASSDWHWETDAEGRLTFTTDHFYEVVGLRPEGAIGKTLKEVFRSNHGSGGVSNSDNWRSHFSMMAGRESFRNIEIDLATPDFNRRFFLSSARATYGAGGKFSGYRGTLVEITAIKEAEIALSTLNETLEQRVDARTAELRDAQESLLLQERLATLGQLTATVAHEIRNPLGAIANSFVVIKHKCTEAGLDLQNALARTDRSIARCNNIITELLDFTRATGLQPEPVILDDWVSSVIDEQHIADGVILRRDFQTGETVLSFDPEALRRAVINVIENACQAMIESEGNGEDAILTVATRINGQEANIVFEDTGPGIPKDVLPKVVEPFFSTKSFGTGLGLPTVRRIMKEHGGGLEIRSEDDYGTVVILRLPLRPIIAEDAVAL